MFIYYLLHGGVEVTISDSNTRILIIIPKELKEELEKKAKENNRSVSNYIVTLIKKDVADK